MEGINTAVDDVEPSEAKQAGTELKKSLASLSAPYQSGRFWFAHREDGIFFLRARSGRGTKGPRGLVPMCLRVLANNFTAASEDSIRALPEDLRHALWKELAPRAMPLYAWHILGGGLLDDSVQRAEKALHGKKQLDGGVRPTMAMYRYCQEILNPPCPLSVYIDPLKGLDKCLVYLCLDNAARFGKHELLSLADLHQLAVLELIQSEPDPGDIDDDLIRSWSRLTGFKSLSVLRIVSDKHGITTRSLDYLSRFPALEVFDITDPGTQDLTPDRDHAFDWNVSQRGAPLLETYAKAYLNGFVEVKVNGLDRLTMVFDDDRQELAPVKNPRISIDERRRKERLADDDHGHLSNFLDEGWRELLLHNPQSSSPTTIDAQIIWEHSSAMTDDQVFWLLGLLDQDNHDMGCRRDIQMQAKGVTLPSNRFVSLRLRCSSKRHWLLLSRRRRIFYKRQGNKTAPEHEPAPSTEEQKTAQNSQATSHAAGQPETEATQFDRDPPTSWAPRADDRKETNLQARKRQKTVGDLLSSM